MTFYSDIRKYFKERIAASDSDLKEWKDALVFDDANNIPTTLLNTRYHIAINSWTSSPAQDQSVHDQFSITLTLLKKGFTEPQDALDDLLDKVLDIRHELINPLNVEAFKIANNSAILAVENTSGAAGEIDSTNDNTVKVALEFNVRLYFCAFS
jgi:hypothetical protein